MRRGFTAACVALILLAALVTPAAADGIVVPRDPAAPPLAIKYHHVQVHIADQVATTHVDQAFVNEWDRELEGTYIFPIPESAAISDFTLEVDGQTLEGRLLDKDEARRIYEAITGQRRDPALLEYVGRDAFQASVYPIPSQGQRRIQIGYNEVLRANGDTVYYRYPLNTEKFSSQPIEDVAVTVRVAASRDIQAVYSPSHDVAVHRVDTRTVEVSYEAQDETPTQDFELYYVLGEGTIATSLMTYHGVDGDGFFLLLLAPPPMPQNLPVVDKDVIFVLDTSGSMNIVKLNQARGALRFALNHLNPGDWFNIVAFNSTVSAYADGLVPASEAPQAQRYVNGLQARGSTNIDGALAAALKLAAEAPTRGGGERLQLIIFLTDGLPNVGEREPDRIVANVKDRAPAGLRLFTWGVGYDVNTVLLDTLALEQHGASDYVCPDEDVAAKVSAFYRKIQDPALVNVALAFQGVETYDLYPAPLPDLFFGEQLVVTGRFKGQGPADLVLTGQVNGIPQTRIYRNLAFGTDRSQDFIPRLWATRKVGYLMSQIRLHGADKELVDEAGELGRRYGIVTPYTSFLVEEEPVDTNDRLAEEEPPDTTDRLRAAPGARTQEWAVYLWSLDTAPEAGADAVDQSQRNKALREADRAAPATQEIRHVGDRAFTLQDGVWTDSRYEEGMPVKVVVFGSADYYGLLTRRPDWGPVLALGTDVIVVEGRLAYRVSEKEQVTVAGTTTPDQVLNHLGEILDRLYSLWPSRLRGGE